MSNRNRGSKTSKGVTSLQCFLMVKIRQTGKYLFETKAFIKSYRLSVIRLVSTNFEDKIFIRGRNVILVSFY